MLRSDIAVSSGGSTLYELCACGTPTLAFILADNQEAIVREMNEQGYVISLGWLHQIKPEGLIDSLKALIENEILRRKLSNRGKNLVDARGSERVVAAIEDAIFSKSGSVD
jgi:spore coat polysaccharide biosynthesis predicted glycosyltransferase SpsG